MDTLINWFAQTLSGIIIALLVASAVTMVVWAIMLLLTYLGPVGTLAAILSLPIFNAIGKRWLGEPF